MSSVQAHARRARAASRDRALTHNPSPRSPVAPRSANADKENAGVPANGADAPNTAAVPKGSGAPDRARGAGPAPRGGEGDDEILAAGDRGDGGAPALGADANGAVALHGGLASIAPVPVVPAPVAPAPARDQSSGRAPAVGPARPPLATLPRTRGAAAPAPVALATLPPPNPPTNPGPGVNAVGSTNFHPANHGWRNLAAEEPLGGDDGLVNEVFQPKMHAPQGVHQLNKGNEMRDPTSATRLAIADFEACDYPAGPDGPFGHVHAACSACGQCRPVPRAANDKARAAMSKWRVLANGVCTMCSRHDTAERRRARPPPPLPLSRDNHMGVLDKPPPCISGLSWLGRRLVALYVGVFTLEALGRGGGALKMPRGWSCSMTNDISIAEAIPRLNVELIVILPTPRTGGAASATKMSRRYYASRPEIELAIDALKNGIPSGGCAAPDPTRRAVHRYEVDGKFYEYFPQAPWRHVAVDRAALARLPDAPGVPECLEVYHLTEVQMDLLDEGPAPRQMLVDDGVTDEEWTHSGIANAARPRACAEELRKQLANILDGREADDDGDGDAGAVGGGGGGGGGGRAVGVGVARLPVLQEKVKALDTDNYYWSAHPEIFWNGRGDITCVKRRIAVPSAAEWAEWLWWNSARSAARHPAFKFEVHSDIRMKQVGVVVAAAAGVGRLRRRS